MKKKKINIYMVVLFLSIGLLLLVMNQNSIKKHMQNKQGLKNNLTSQNVIELTFWHGMGNNTSANEAIKELVGNFNKSQVHIKVKIKAFDEYENLISKLKNTARSRTNPDIVQMYDIGTRYMIDSKTIMPIQNFIDADKYDISALEPNLLEYYTIDNKLYSMPFNASTIILYYNKNAFIEAGLDPNKPPRSLSEINKIGNKLIKKDSKGNVKQYAYAMAAYGWFFEEFIAKQNLTYANNGNGRDSRATSIEFDKNGGGLSLLKEWKKLIDSGVAFNYGLDRLKTEEAFFNGEVAMIIQSSAQLKRFIDNTKNKFDIKTSFFPGVNLNKNNTGTVVGGASIWIMDNGATEREKAAWEFTKYLISPNSQLYWHKNTGYIPVTRKVYKLPEMKQHLIKYPQFQTAIDQLHATPINVSTKGALIGVMPEARVIIANNIELMLENKLGIDKTLKNIMQGINKAIAKYNRDYIN
jgi:sn-glycerol 3-phosphate transport system substrate-binding protein